MDSRRLATPAAAGMVAVAALLTAVPAEAQSNRELQQQLEQLKQQMQVLERQLEATQKQAATAAEDAAATREEVDNNNVEFKWGPAPTLRSKDGRFEFKVRGRLFADYGYLTGDNQKTSNFEIRTARIGVEGVAWQDVGYKLEADFADNEVDLKDAIISYEGFDSAKVQVGHFKTPNSLEEQTSSRYITFMERASFTDAFNLDRRIGVGGGFNGENWHVKGGLFGQNTGNGADYSWGAVGLRGHYAIAMGESDAIHLGASYRYRNCSNDVDSSSACGDGEVRYRQRPHLHMTGTRHINTGTIDGMESDHFFGPEFAMVMGPFSVQSEAGLLWGSRRDEGVEGPTGGNFGPLWGAYADASYFLTGESRNYNKKKGSFGRVKVKNPVHDGGMGAWQVAGRFDYMSLEDAGNGIEGGEQWSVIGGLNWHLNNNVRTMLNMNYTNVSGGPVGVNDASGDNDIFGVGVRGQVDW